jgi:hypothetical protein
MGGLLIDYMTQLTVYFFADANAQGWKVALFFFFHCELYLVVESSEVVQKFCQFFLAMGPNDKSVMYIPEPASRFVCCLF